MSSFLDYLKEDQSSTSDNATRVPVTDQQKSTALRYARNIQYQRSLKEKVLDLIINTVDLPSRPDADPSRPAASDVTLFKQALTLFQPKDVDDVVLERNIYEKCGYALCPRPNLKQNAVLRDQVFRSMKQGRQFRLSSKEELERWCSVECLERALFVRLQLATEPAWLRNTPVEEITLLDESGERPAADGLTSSMKSLGFNACHEVDLASSLQQLALDQGKKADIQDRMQALSLERGENDRTPINSSILTDVKDKDTSSTPLSPYPHRPGNESVEGRIDNELDGRLYS